MDERQVIGQLSESALYQFQFSGLARIITLLGLHHMGRM